MGNNLARMVSTLGIWAAVTIIAVAMIVNQIYMSSATTVILGGLLFLVALTSTRAVWKDDNSYEAEKSKRTSRVERLISALDQRDLDELRDRLMADGDGEATSIEELLNVRESRRP